MKFSIIIPIYNMEKYLKCCLDSVVAQTFTDYEIILVDDGSTDASKDMCEMFAKGYSEKCQVVHKPNGGLSSARNAGLDVAKGEWILFLDSDDYISPDLLETVAKEMSQNPADLYTFNVRRVNQAGEYQEKLLYHYENQMIKFTDAQSLDEHILNDILNYKDGWEAWNRVYKRELIEKCSLRFVDTKKVLAEDLCFYLDYFIHIDRMYKICNILYYYRSTPGSILANLKQDEILTKLFALTEHFYESCRKYDRALCKSFDKVYKSIVDYHVKYKLEFLSNEDIVNQLLEIRRSSRNGRRWISKNIVLVERENVKKKN